MRSVVFALAMVAAGSVSAETLVPLPEEIPAYVTQPKPKVEPVTITPEAQAELNKLFADKRANRVTPAQWVERTNAISAKYHLYVFDNMSH